MRNIFKLRKTYTELYIYNRRKANISPCAGYFQAATYNCFIKKKIKIKNWPTVENEWLAF